MQFSTQAIHSGYTPNELDGAIIPPLHLSTTFKFGNQNNYDYSRSGNPTREILEKTLSSLDGNTHGLAFSSGSSTLATIVSLLDPGEKILFSSDAYGGTYRFIVNVAAREGKEYSITDFTDLEETEAILQKENIKIVWVETPTNPLLKVTDIKKLASIAHKQNAYLIVDNTFASPIFQQPAEYGADIVVYSTTKYINGHSDSIGGFLSTSNKELYQRLKFLQNAYGTMLSPFDSWLTLRGLKTLELRMARHGENAEALAHFLDKHPKTSKVYYPSLFHGTQGEIVKKQMRHPGGMISIELRPDSNVQAFLNATKYFPLAESLGGIESLIDHPATMTHGSIPKEEREKIGLSDSLLRISVGIENIQDLLSDLESALKKA